MVDSPSFSKKRTTWPVSPNSRSVSTFPYTDAATNLRYYGPDFVVVTTDGMHHLIETKSREDINVIKR